jgi:energy-coupling factor transporter transmembrane protein EcfT
MVRLGLSVFILACAVIATRVPAIPLTVLVVIALVVCGLSGRSARTLLKNLTPIAVFIATVALLQWLQGKVDWLLPLRTLAVFLLSTSAVRMVPWAWCAGHISPQSPLYLPGLFLLFVRHFTEILILETQRTLRARNMCAPSLFRPGGCRSLVCALTSIFHRVLARAERFYAAQTLNRIAS